MSDIRTFLQVAKGMTVTEAEKVKHVPWWHGRKYRYNTYDPISGRKIRPGVKIARTICEHPDNTLTMEMYLEMRKRTPRGEYVLCPLCRMEIPEQEDENNFVDQIIL